MTKNTAVWVGLGLVLLHNLEELLTMGYFLAAHREALPSFLRPMGGGQFSVSLAIFTAMATAVTVAAVREHQQWPWLLIVIAMHVSLGVNAIQHAAIAAWARGYAPGVLTGWTLILPYSIYLALRAVSDRWVTVRSLGLTTTALIVLTLPFLMGMHVISGTLARLS